MEQWLCIDIPINKWHPQVLEWFINYFAGRSIVVPQFQIQFMSNSQLILYSSVHSAPIFQNLIGHEALRQLKRQFLRSHYWADWIIEDNCSSSLLFISFFNQKIISKDFDWISRVFIFDIPHTHHSWSNLSFSFLPTYILLSITIAVLPISFKNETIHSWLNFVSWYLNQTLKIMIPRRKVHDHF